MFNERFTHLVMKVETIDSNMNSRNRDRSPNVGGSEKAKKERKISPAKTVVQRSKEGIMQMQKI